MRVVAKTTLDDTPKKPTKRTKKQKTILPPVENVTEWDRNRTVDEVLDVVNRHQKDLEAHPETAEIRIKLCRNNRGSPHIRVRISPDSGPHEGEAINASLGESILGLKDTGSTKTLLSKAAFEGMKDVHLYQRESSDTVMTTALSGEKAATCDIIHAVLTFEEESGKSFKIRHKIFVVPDLSDPLILGDDIFQRHTQIDMQDYVLMTPDKIPTNVCEQLTGLQVREQCVKLPVEYISPDRNKVRVVTAVEKCIQPNSPRVVPLALQDPDGRTEKWHDKAIHIEPADVDEVGTAKFRLTTGWSPYYADFIPAAPVTNHSGAPLILRAGTFVGWASLLDDSDGMQTRRFDIGIRQADDIFCRKARVKKQLPATEWGVPTEEDLRARARYLLDKQQISDPNERARFEEELATQGHSDAPIDAEPDGEVTELKYEPPAELDFETEFAKVKIGARGKPYMKKIRDMLYRQREVFQVGGQLEKTHMAEVKPDFKPIIKPIIQKQRPIPEQLRPEVDQIIAQLLKDGILERAEKPPICLSNLHYTRKPTGEVRLLCDLRAVNAQTRRMDYPSMSLEESICRLSTAALVSALDIASAYWSVPLEKEARRYFAFNTPSHGLVQYSCLVMGWQNSSFYLAEVLDRVFAGIPDLIKYIDDILVHQDSKDVPKHIDHLERVLKALRQAKFKIKASKLDILPEAVDYLGVCYVLDGDKTMSIPQHKIDAYINAARPNRPTGVKSFLMSTAYYRRWIPRFAHETYRLHIESLKPPKGRFHWSTNLEKIYVHLCHLMKTHGTILIPNPHKDFVSLSDASQVACSFILMQQGKDGMWKICSCSSKLFSEAHAAKHIYIKELLALTTGIMSHQFFLRHCRRLISYTDARGLSVVNMVKHHDNFLMRKALFLSMFPITIYHISGIRNCLADHLSRFHMNQRACDKPQIKGLTATQAIRVLDAVHFRPIKLTPEEIRQVLVNGPSQPGPDDEKVQRRAPTPARELKDHGLGAPIRPGRKIKMPLMTNYTPLIPGLRNQLENSGWFGRERQRLEAEKEGTRTDEEEKEWLRSKYGTDPITLSCEEDKAYFKWVEKPVGPPPDPPPPPKLNVDCKLTTIREPHTLSQDEDSDTSTILDQPPEYEDRHSEDSDSGIDLSDEEYNEHDWFTSETDSTPWEVGPTHAPRRLTCRAVETRSRRRKSADNAASSDVDGTTRPAGTRKRHNTAPQQQQDPPSADASTSSNTPIVGEHPLFRSHPADSVEADDTPCCPDNAAGLDCEHAATVQTWTLLATRPLFNTISLQQFRECQDRDPFCHKTKAELKKEQERPATSAVKRKRFTLIDGVLSHTDTKGKIRKVLPLTLLKHKVQVMHYSSLGLHTSHHKITNTITADYYYPNLLKKVRELVEDCAICPFVNRPMHKEEAHGVIDYPTKPRSSYSCDWVSGLPTTPDGYTSVLIVIDRFSLLVRYYPVKKRSASETIRVLKLVAQADANPIAFLKSDQEPCLKTDEFIQYCAENGIKHRFTAAGNPQSNGLTETLGTKWFKKAVKHLVREQGEDWSQSVHLLTISHAKAICKTGVTGEVGHFGFSATSPFSILNLDLERPLTELVEGVQEEIRERRKKHIEQRKKRQEAKNDPRPQFQPGDTVMYHENPIKAHATVKLRNSGPYRICDEQEPDSYSVWCTHLTTGHKRKFPMKDLTPYRAITPQNEIDPPVEVERDAAPPTGIGTN